MQIIRDKEKEVVQTEDSPFETCFKLANIVLDKLANIENRLNYFLLPEKSQISNSVEKSLSNETSEFQNDIFKMQNYINDILTCLNRISDRINDHK